MPRRAALAEKPVDGPVRQRGENRGGRGEIPCAIVRERLVPPREVRGCCRVDLAPQRLPDRERLGPALDAYAIDLAPDEFRRRAFRLLAAQDAHAVDLRQPLEPRREIDRVAQHRVGLAEARAHVADVHRAGVEADADRERRPAARTELRAQRLHPLLHRERRRDGILRVARVRQRRSPEGHDGVADVLVDGAATGVDDLRHRRQVGVHQRGELARLQRLRGGGEVADVGEQHRELAAVALHRESLAGLAHLAHALGRHVLAEEVGQLSNRSRFAQEPAQQVPEEERQQHRERARDRDHCVRASPEQKVDRGDDGSDGEDPDHAGERTPPRDAEHDDEAGDQHRQRFHLGGACRDALEVAGKHSGNQVRVDFDAGEIGRDRRGPQVLEALGRRPDERNGADERVVRNRSRHDVGRRVISECALAPPIRDERGAVARDRDDESTQVERVEIAVGIEARANRLRLDDRLCDGERQRGVVDGRRKP